MNWDHMRLLLSIGRSGTLSAAGRVLGVDQTTVGRRLAAAEAAFGGRLFLRAGGSLVPTEGCALLLDRAAAMEAQMEAAQHALSDVAAALVGPVRITAVESIILHLLVPLASALRETLPGIVPVFLPDERTLDLTRRQADIALRLAQPTEQDLKARRLADIALAVYAAPGIGEGWLAYDESRAHLPEAQWLAAHLATRPATERTPRLRCGSVGGLAEAAARGLGRAVLPCFLGDGHPGLRRITEPVLTRPLWMVLHAGLGRVPRVRAAADWLADTIARPVLRARLEGRAGDATD